MDKEITKIRVLYGDTDSGGMVYYANYFRFFEAGRNEFIRSRVCSYKEMEERGFILPVVESHARYKASAVYDDLLIVETRLSEVRNVSCRFDNRIIRESDGKLLVKGYTVHAIVDLDGKLSKFPQDILDGLKDSIDSA